MASNNANLNINGVDFDTIKSNLKTYLKGQTQFKDYDFEGSGISTLLDILSLNTHYNAYYANIVANESFLDSANRKESVVSLSKQLGYIGKSYKSAVAYVDVQFINLTATEQTNIQNGLVYIPAGGRFIINAGNKLFLFLATTATKVTKEASGYFARNVEIKEGIQKSITFVYDNNENTDQKFVIPDTNVDVDSLDVRVVNSINDSTGSDVLWSKVTDINNLSSESTSYFLQQNFDLNYEIYFGDGIIGKAPIAGNVIVINYRLTNGSVANSLGKNETTAAPAFTYAENSKTKTALVLDTDGKPTPTFGGSDGETIQSMKYYAPRNYQAQERAVTAEDYRTLLAREYGEQAESVFVWGGEDNDPPIYGKVFISIKPVGAEKLSSLEKLAIAKNVLKDRNVVSILPEVVDPDYLYLLFTTNITYDYSKTSLTSDNLAATLKYALYQYGLTNIGKFDRNFYYSAFISYINTTYSPPIISSDIAIQMQKRFIPNLGTISPYTINFDNPLYHPIAGYSSILTSTGFGYQDSTSTATIKPNVDCYLDDDGNGNVRIYKLVNTSKIYINSTIGTIDYDTGKVSLVNFAPQYLTTESDTEIKLTVTPLNKDILSRRNEIIILENEGITVNAIPQTLRYDPYSASASSFPSV